LTNPDDNDHSEVAKIKKKIGKLIKYEMEYLGFKE